jgi:hypothetical protein
MNKKIKKPLVKIQKDKNNLFLYQLGFLKSKIKNARQLTNENIKQFIDNNKYILIAITVVILAGLGYKVVNYATSVRQKTSKITASIDNIYKIIESDDRFLNNSQQAIKYLYLYITEPNEFTKNKVKELYDLQSNFLIDDLAQKSRVIINSQYDGGLDHSLNLLKKADENLDQSTINNLKNIIKASSTGATMVETGKSAIANTTQGLSDLVSATTSTIGNLFGSFGKSQIKQNIDFDNTDITNECFDKTNRKYLKYKNIDDFILNYDLAEELFKNDYNDCYIQVKNAMDIYKDDNKRNSCAGIFIDLDEVNINEKSIKEFIKFYSNIYDDAAKISEFMKCYNE